MTAKELIKILEEMPAQAEVVIVHGEWNIKHVEIDRDKAIIKIR